MTDKSEMIFGVRAVIEAFRLEKKLIRSSLRKTFKVIFPKSFSQH